MGRRWANKTNPLATMSKHAHRPKDPSPTNAANFLSEGWAGQQNGIIGYKNYYLLHEHVLCTRAFSTSAVASMIDNGAYPPGSTELDDETGHNWRMPRTLYPAFCELVLGLGSESWANTSSEAAFRNMLLQDLDAILHYYAITYTVPASKDGVNEPISLLGDQADMARILAWLTILLIGANTCTPYTINLVWGENEPQMPPLPVQDCNQHNIHLDNSPQTPSPQTQLVELSISPPNPSNHPPTLPREALL